MARGARTVLRLLLAAAVLVAAGLVFTLWGDRRSARDLLPGGAVLALELRDADELVERLEDTRFAAALSAGPTYAWLERSDVARAIDGVRAGIGRVSGFTPRRRHLLGLAGSDSAIAWYPAAAGAPAAASPWLAAGRPSLPAWALASAARVALRVGLGGSGVSREEVAGTTVLAIGSGAGALHLFLTRRLLVVGNDRELARRAARLAAGEASGLAATESWRRVAAELPVRGSLRAFVRGDQLSPWAGGSAGGGARAAGAVVSSGSPVTVDLFVDAPLPPQQRAGTTGAPPALALAGTAPLFLHAAAGPLPQSLVDLLAARVAAVARRDGAPARGLPALGEGLALAITSFEEGGLFPRPQGIVAIGMRNADAARELLRLLFPPGARALATRRWGTALSTRESLPLAGEFELWGAAAGERLVFATQPALIAALEAGGTPAGRVGAAGGEGDLQADTLSSLDVTRFLPAARRYAPPLAGLLRARVRGLPDVSRDFELLAAVRTVGVVSGATPAGIRSRITLEVGDLPPAH